MRILVIEDETALSEIISEILEKNNYSVDAVYDGSSGYDYAISGSYDLILLDIMLPVMNGLEVIKKLRSNGYSIPVLMLTALSETDDKVKGLDYGADDYVTKPFETSELLARVRSLTRRKDVFISDEQSFGDLTLNKDALSFSTSKDTIKVSLKEFQILELFLKNPNQILSKEQFIEKIWGYDFDGEYNSVEVYISFVRKKLNAIGSTVKIKVHRNIGYTLEKSND